MRERETPELMKKEHTNILFLSRVFCIVLAFQFASKTQKEAAHGGGAQLNEKMKKDMKIMFLSLVSHFVCFALQFKKWQWLFRRLLRLLSSSHDPTRVIAEVTFRLVQHVTLLLMTNSVFALLEKWEWEVIALFDSEEKYENKLRS